VLTGDDEGEKEQLTKLFGKNTQFWFKQTPFDKLEKIKSLDQEAPVLMVGDGLNDAGALKVASVGLSVTQDISNFTPASDIIVYAKEIGYLSRLLQFAKSCVKVVYINFGISFLYNIVGLLFAVSGLLSPVFAAILMPLSSVTVVVFSVISTNYLSRK
jgi:Cu+-exporting ATPase